MTNNTNAITFTEKLEAELAEVFNALKRIASGDPTVRISEYSEIESIRNLKYMVNTTAKEIGEIVEQSHEFAIGLAEHFDVLLKVSHGNFDARVTGNSETELLESLKNVTNKMIENIDREITERKKATRTLRESEEKLRMLSLTDELTGLYNRRGFYTLAEHLMKASRRNGMKLYLLYVDLDNMKVINDKHGHKEGDKALAHFARILRENCRESDVISRIGGDEFAIIMQEGKTDKTIDLIISRLQHTLNAEIAANESGYTLSASTGVASYHPNTPSSLDDLLSHADRMMYRQKKSKLYV